MKPAIKRLENLLLGALKWYGLREISKVTGSPEASVSADLRTLRSRGYVILKRHKSPGSTKFLYRLITKDEAQQEQGKFDAML
jgi:biotin operon repressor